MKKMITMMEKPKQIIRIKIMIKMRNKKKHYQKIIKIIAAQKIYLIVIQI
jgi:hypothetical protein